jgi:succinate-semialdehyde dehydrogenase/glutarate-semialdehyde dehydrogenase
MTETLPPTPESLVRPEASPVTAKAIEPSPRSVWPTVSISSSRISIGQLQALGERVVTGDGSREVMAVEQPFTGRPLGEVPRSSLADVDLAFERARAAHESWKNTSFPERRAVLLHFHDLLLSRRDELLDLIQLETGKARRHAIEEVLDVAMVSRYYAHTAEHHLRSHRRRGAIPVLTATWEYHHPLGVVGLIAPWNYPFTLTLGDALPAVAAGNAVVLKPDSQTPFTALWGVDLLEEAGFPRDLISVVAGSGSELGPRIIDHADYMMFTGSSQTGRAVAQRAAGRLIGSSMELGGKNAMIVLPDANLARTVEGAERALFSNAGQLCISIERLLVHDSIADEFTGRLVERVQAIRMGTALDYTVGMGSLISQTQLETVREHVDDAVAKGARVLTGGRHRPDIGPYFFEPTILSGVDETMTLCRNETFGPVVAVSSFTSEEDAVRRANDSDYGLNFSVWTRATAAGRELATRLKAGTVNVNEGYVATWGSVDAPMGGMKASGLGRRHGQDGIRKYTEPQTVSVQRLLPIAPFYGMSADLWSTFMVNALRVLRRVPGIR